MSLTQDEKVKVRSMVNVAAEPVPFFWPMRAFIHHNPLHGLEGLPFDKAVVKGSKIFHGRTFLPRATYQSYLAEGRIDQDKVDALIEEFVGEQDSPGGLNLLDWSKQLLYKEPYTFSCPDFLGSAADTHAALTGEGEVNAEIDRDILKAYLRDQLLGDRPLGESIDALFGSKITDDLNELFVKSCLHFYDEGQSVWNMPMREEGFFNAWKKLAKRNVRFTLLGLKFKNILEADGSAEGTIIYALRRLGIDKEHWTGYFTRELAHLHGWSGFIRWREQAKDYHYNKKFPGDLVDFMAVRLTLALALIEARGGKLSTSSVAQIEEMIDERCEEVYLRHEFHSRKVLPTMAHKVDMAISSRGNQGLIQKTFDEYFVAKRKFLADQQANRLRELASEVDQRQELENIKIPELEKLLTVISEVEANEGMFWLRGMEQKAISRLKSQLRLNGSSPQEDRSFAQALFCIDTRSERIRRNLESVGDYQTFGIAGFFGVPVSFIGLGKGSETHLAPVILTPENVVLEITIDALSEEIDTLTTLDKAMHGLKESVVSPFVTVEAIGLLFGLEMIGKTIAPKGYSKWRNKLGKEKPETLLLLDKFSEDQARSILETLQHALIIKGVKQDLGYNADQISDYAVHGLHNIAMENEQDAEALCALLKIDHPRLNDLIKHLREDYRINRDYAEVQMKELSRVGFSLDEQANFVASALKAIGLTEGFSRFVLIVGHGSFTENNPYESALDCGACGGNHGLVSARVIAQMANRSGVRQRVAKLGIEIPEDVWFIPALHNTTTDEIRLHDLDKILPSQLFYLDALRKALAGASHLTAQERLPSLSSARPETAIEAFHLAQRSSTDWSQVRPEWGLSRNCYFIIGRRDLTRDDSLDGRAFLHSYDYKVDTERKLLEGILTGPLVVGQWINMEHYFSAVDNEQFGSGSKVYHNVSGRFGVMSGNQSDLRTGLPSQTVLKDGKPFHEPVRLMTLIEAPVEHAQKAIEAVPSVKQLMENEWIRVMILDPETSEMHTFESGSWSNVPFESAASKALESQSV